MGLVKRLLKLATKSPKWNGRIAAMTTVPWAMYKQFQYLDESPDGSLAGSAKYFIVPFISFIATYLSTIGLHLITQGPRLSDYKKIKSLEKRIQEQPEMPLTGNQELSYGIRDVLRYHHSTTEALEQRARELENPLIAIDVALKYFEERKIDKALTLLRDGFDWLGGRQPQLKRLAKFLTINQGWAFETARKLDPTDVGAYMLCAAHYSITRPREAWRISSLGRLVADEFKSENRKEMYVLHALLASAQKRSDKKQAWIEAALIMREQPVWERIGETRTIVRKLENSPFLAETVVFKEHTTLETLEREANACRKLKEKRPHIDATEVLYQDEKPYEGTHTLIMRTIPGETIFHALKNGEKVNMTPVIDTLAEIHAAMSDEGNNLSIKWNLKNKLRAKDFRIPLAKAKQIVRNYRPVLKAITDNAVWVYNKDAHPENWIKKDNKIAAIDFEGKELVPAQFDLANLLEYGNFFTRKEIRRCVNRYYQMAGLEGVQMENENGSVNEKMFMRGYYNAVIHRMISLSSAWSSPKRPNMHLQRRHALARALYAIKRLREEDKEYYITHEDEYRALRKELAQLVPKPASSQKAQTQ